MGTGVGSGVGSGVGVGLGSCVGVAVGTSVGVLVGVMYWMGSGEEDEGTSPPPHATLRIANAP